MSLEPPARDEPDALADRGRRSTLQGMYAMPLAQRSAITTRVHRSGRSGGAGPPTGDASWRSEALSSGLGPRWNQPEDVSYKQEG